MVDHGHLEELVEALGAEQMNGLIKRFLSEMDEAVIQIARSLESVNVDASLRDGVHPVAGADALLGAEALRTNLANLENEIAYGHACEDAKARQLLDTWARPRPEPRLHIQPP